jgi:hypothetical protein
MVDGEETTMGEIDDGRRRLLRLALAVLPMAIVGSALTATAARADDDDDDDDRAAGVGIGGAITMTAIIGGVGPMTTIIAGVVGVDGAMTIDRHG